MPVTVPAARDEVPLVPGPSPTVAELPSLPTAAAAVLQLARDLLDGRGWTPYLQRPDDIASGVPACTIVQAIESVTGTDRSGIPQQLRREALARLHAALTEDCPAYSATDLAGWEKKHGRTQREVIDLLHRATASATAIPTGFEGPPTQAEHHRVRDGAGRVHRVPAGSLECVR